MISTENTDDLPIIPSGSISPKMEEISKTENNAPPVDEEEEFEEEILTYWNYLGTHPWFPSAVAIRRWRIRALFYTIFIIIFGVVTHTHVQKYVPKIQKAYNRKGSGALDMQFDIELQELEDQVQQQYKDKDNKGSGFLVWGGCRATVDLTRPYQTDCASLWEPRLIWLGTAHKAMKCDWAGTWVDSHNESCADYEAQEYCADGALLYDVSEYAANGFDASICPQCGCKDTKGGSDKPAISWDSREPWMPNQMEQVLPHGKDPEVVPYNRDNPYLGADATSFKAAKKYKAKLEGMFWSPEEITFGLHDFGGDRFRQHRYNPSMIGPDLDIFSKKEWGHNSTYPQIYPRVNLVYLGYGATVGNKIYQVGGLHKRGCHWARYDYDLNLGGDNNDYFPLPCEICSCAMGTSTTYQVPCGNIPPHMNPGPFQAGAIYRPNQHLAWQTVRAESVHFKIPDYQTYLPPLSGYACGEAHGLVYSFGSRNGIGTKKEAGDPWKEHSKLNEKRVLHAGAVLHNRIYVCGGDRHWEQCAKKANSLKYMEGQQRIKESNKITKVNPCNHWNAGKDFKRWNYPLLDGNAYRWGLENMEVTEYFDQEVLFAPKTLNWRGIYRDLTNLFPTSLQKQESATDQPQYKKYNYLGGLKMGKMVDNREIGDSFNAKSWKKAGGRCFQTRSKNSDGEAIYNPDLKDNGLEAENSESDFSGCTNQDNVWWWWIGPFIEFSDYDNKESGLEPNATYDDINQHRYFSEGQSYGHFESEIREKCEIDVTGAESCEIVEGPYKDEKIEGRSFWWEPRVKPTWHFGGAHRTCEFLDLNPTDAETGEAKDIETEKWTFLGLKDGKTKIEMIHERTYLPAMSKFKFKINDDKFKEGLIVTGGIGNIVSWPPLEPLGIRDPEKFHTMHYTSEYVEINPRTGDANGEWKLRETNFPKPIALTTSVAMPPPHINICPGEFCTPVEELEWHPYIIGGDTPNSETIKTPFTITSKIYRLTSLEGEWEVVGDMILPRRLMQAVASPLDRKIIVVGGAGTSDGLPPSFFDTRTKEFRKIKGLGSYDFNLFGMHIAPFQYGCNDGKPAKSLETITSEASDESDFSC